ncbi:MAG: thiol reductase thioredoxin [Rhodobacteraceae bacterium]|nr:thiol reductase thioredoxin [Paracoccaceae bacterium]
MDYIKLACLKCGQGNRVPKDKVYQGPKCASCGAGLMPSKVSECKTMTPEFEKAASKLSGKARLAKLNTEQYQSVATKLGIRGVPTLIGYRDGKEVFRKSGAMPAQQIEMLVKTHAK